MQFNPAEHSSYEELASALRALIGTERDWLANSANFVALVYHSLPELNWVGFYFNKGQELVLGPFQGRPACIRIGWGKGVCGTAARERRTLIVPDVHAFPGHIACDVRSRSELVVPLLVGERVLGVLDLDSPKLARFGEDDARGIERLAAIWLESLDQPLEFA